MKGRSSLLWYAIGIAVVALLPAVIRSEYDIHIFVMVWIFSLLVIGFNFIFGYIGQLSLGQGAFFAIGAYASALATLKWGVPFWVGLPFAALVAGIFGVVIGAIALRWRSHFFVIATICFNGIIYLMILNWVSLTNGPVGIGNIPIPSLGGMVFSTKVHFTTSRWFLFWGPSGLRKKLFHHPSEGPLPPSEKMSLLLNRLASVHTGLRHWRLP